MGGVMKTTCEIGKALRCAAMMFLSWFVLVAGVTAQEDLIISDDATGGNCTAIGTWDNATKTCIVTSDLLLPVVILSDGITLDGNGHFMRGPGYGNGIEIKGLANVAVRNMIIEAFSNAIMMYEANGAVIVDNTVRNSNCGIFLTWYSMQNSFIGNRIEGNDIGMQAVWLSQDNVIENNIFEGNTIGLNIGYSLNNEIVNNAFLDNDSQLASRGFVNLIEANYWNDYDSPPEGCLDANGDSFCDEPYVIPGGSGAMDSLPGNSKDVDTTPPVVYVEATPSVLPNTDSHVNVLITGYADDTKSGVNTVVITLKDEYGVYDQVVGGFGSVVTLKAKTAPKDLDGRTYTITATAVDAMGNEASAIATVFVPKR